MPAACLDSPVLRAPLALPINAFMWCNWLVNVFFWSAQNFSLLAINPLASLTAWGTIAAGSNWADFSLAFTAVHYSARHYRLAAGLSIMQRAPLGFRG